MVVRIRVAALVVAVFALAAFAGACGSGSSDGGATPSPTPSPQSSDEATPSATPSPQASKAATAQARDTLRAFFAAWQAKDVTALERYLPAARKGVQWEFDVVERVEFGKISESPELVDQYLTNGSGYASGVARENVRCFQADVTFFYKPGQQGSADEGQPLAWHWFLERDDAGDWLVADQGF